MSIQPKDLRYTITDRDGVYQVLTYAPSGWDDSLVTWARSDKYYGLYRSFTVPMRFVKEGAELLKGIYANEGVEGYAQVKIERLNRSTWQYATYYIGEVDFQGCKWDDSSIEVNLVEGGLSKFIKVNEEKVYEIDNVSSNVMNWGTIGSPIDKTFYHLSGIFSQLASKVSNGLSESTGYGVQSQFLYDMETPGGFEKLDILTMMTGRDLRLTKVQGYRPMKISLKDFFEAVNSVYCLGMGVEIIAGVETLVLESRSYFYEDTEIADVGAVADLKVSPYKEVLFNRITTGFDGGGDANTTNAGYDFCIPTEFSVPFTKVRGEYGIRSRIPASWIAIDQRMAGSSDPEVVESGDEDNYFLNSYYNVIQDKYNPQSGSVQNEIGSYANNAWNASISPWRAVAWKHLAWIDSCCDGLEVVYNGTYNISFISSEGNNKNNITDDVINDPVTESANITGGESTKIFKPILFEFRCVSPSTLFELFDAEHKGYISFTYKGTPFKGFILEVSSSPQYGSTQTFKLIAHPDTDLNDLITPPVEELPN